MFCRIIRIVQHKRNSSYSYFIDDGCFHCRCRHPHHPKTKTVSNITSITVIQALVLCTFIEDLGGFEIYRRLLNEAALLVVVLLLDQNNGNDQMLLHAFAGTTGM